MRIVPFSMLDVLFLRIHLLFILYTQVHSFDLEKMLYAGCVFLRRKTASWFELNNTGRTGTTYRIAGTQIDEFLTYNEMLHSGHEGLVMPLGYNDFAEIFNSAPGSTTSFAYVPEGQETLIGSRSSPNRCKFRVTPNDLYHTRQVAPRGSQVLSPSRAGIMMDMLWKNTKEAANVKKDFRPSYEDKLGIEPQGGKHRRVDSEPEFCQTRAVSVAASSSGLTDDLNDIDFRGLLTPIPEEAPVASSSNSFSTSASTSILSASNQDHEMEDTTPNPSQESSAAESSAAPKNAIKFKKTKKN
jgi:hypothetical protein